MEQEKQYSERVDGPTPAGGVYYIAYFRDAKGRRCVKDDTAHYEIVEFDKNNEVLARTYT